MSYPIDGELRPDLTDEEYHAADGIDADALGSTAIRKADTSVDALHHYQEEGIDETKSMRIGTALHAAVLEPGRFEEEYIASRPPERPGEKSWSSNHHAGAAEFGARVLEPSSVDTDVRREVAEDCPVSDSTVRKYTGLDGFDELARHYESHDYDPDDEPLDEESLERVLGMRDAVLEHPRVRGGLLSGGRRELPFFWRERVGDEVVTGKGKGDFVREEADALLVADVKTTSSSAKPQAYARKIGRRNLHMQAGWYCRGLEAATGTRVAHFIFLVVESTPPHHVKPILLGEESLKAGEARCVEAVEKIAEARTGDVYTGYDPSIEKIELKDWEK